MRVRAFIVGVVATATALIFFHIKGADLARWLFSRGDNTDYGITAKQPTYRTYDGNGWTPCR